MRIAGIIAEYDPFHKGHATHIAATRAKEGGQATHIVAVMSGSFTQRGEPASFSKFQRAEMALMGGADLVIELPLPWAMAPAEHFADGGIALLNALGCVDLLSFGSECGNIDLLQKLAAIQSSAAYRTELQKHLGNGIPYAAAVQSAAAHIVGNDAASALASPNNTLGIEYLRSMQRRNVSMDTFTLKRQGADHNDDAPTNGFASASHIRRLIKQGDISYALSYVPNEINDFLLEIIGHKEAPIIKNIIESAVPIILRKMSEYDFAQLPWLSEGLEHRLYKASIDATDYADFIDRVKTKRYPAARLRRIVWSAVLGITAQDVLGMPPYIRILAMNRRGQEILSVASPTLPILTKSSQLKDLDELSNRIFQLETLATDVHALGMPQPIPRGSDYTNKLIVKE